MHYAFTLTDKEYQQTHSIKILHLIMPSLLLIKNINNLTAWRSCTMPPLLLIKNIKKTLLRLPRSNNKILILPRSDSKNIRENYLVVIQGANILWKNTFWKKGLSGRKQVSKIFDYCTVTHSASIMCISGWSITMP